ncbi:MAG: substrate-binding domain-containing protein [Sphingomonadales bacterium]|nr:substrate-binding domain-containing protein [Sphingomonadales bacterium]
MPAGPPYASLRFGPGKRVLMRACLAAGLVALAPSASAASGAPAEKKASYAYDLSALPDYVPGRVEDSLYCHGSTCNGEWGVIRLQASTNMMEMINNWQNAFYKYHPNIKFASFFNPSGIGGIVTKTYDLGFLGHAAWRSDFVAFRDVYGHNPLEIRLTGAFDEGTQPAPVFIVNKDNPLKGLTLEQIDGIFGAERTGGWTDSFEWTTASARGPEKNIRTWGQLGLTGEWADKPIRIYGFDATLSGWSHLIQQVAFKGGDKWNSNLIEKVRGGQKAPADAEIAKAVSEDKYAIGFNMHKVVKKWPDLRIVPVAAAAGSPFVQPTRETVFNRSYPLTNNVYIYLDKPEGQPLPPRLKEFLTFILSRQGQQILAESGKLTPLDAEQSRREIAKLQ